MLDAPARSMLRSIGEVPLQADLLASPQKMIPFEFDFVEIFGLRLRRTWGSPHVRPLTFPGAFIMILATASFSIGSSR